MIVAIVFPSFLGLNWRGDNSPAGFHGLTLSADIFKPGAGPPNPAPGYAVFYWTKTNYLSIHHLLFAFKAMFFIQHHPLEIHIVWQPIRCIVNIHVTPLPWHHFFYRFLDTAQAKPVFHVPDIRFLKPFYWPYLKTI